MSEAFERWLRSVCFQKPTPEAYDLAKCAWDHMDAKLQAAEASNARLREALEYLKRSITVTEHKIPFQLNKSKWLREIEAALEVEP